MITDKRIIKTRTSIKNALMKILQTKELKKVTVSDIAEEALINRSTFYLHYADASEVMADIDREMEEKITKVVERLDVKHTYTSVYILLNKLNDMLEEAEIFKNYLLHSTCSAQVLAKIKKLLTEKAYKTYSSLAPHRKSHSLYYRVTFVISGVVDSYMNWAYSNNKTISLEELYKTTSETIDLIIPKNF
ncbi:MAG: TetR/AcrR family transcriptional regulator [Clostridiales bacterium]|nr:TetR/AcrR family transcriptional regulator [Clostridiales bacterium]